eukprot:scaffold92985_cov30-Tisochrysis_lutea.AAC.2
MQPLHSVRIEPAQPADIAQQRVGLGVHSPIDLKRWKLTEWQQPRRAPPSHLCVALGGRWQPLVSLSRGRKRRRANHTYAQQTPAHAARELSSPTAATRTALALVIAEPPTLGSAPSLKKLSALELLARARRSLSDRPSLSSTEATAYAYGPWSALHCYERGRETSEISSDPVVTCFPSSYSRVPSQTTAPW